ncbi:MAG: hypothetical protein IJO03_08185 [Clostridia bacterium]|nr:hypothetical protein [Clostridia bacterium]
MTAKVKEKYEKMIGEGLTPVRRMGKPNAIITPHIAGSLGNETERMADYMLEQLENYQNGNPLNYEVTKEMLERMA